MKRYKVTGMSCAACSSRIEKAVSKISGVVSCNVSLLTNDMAVNGTASDKDIIKAVKRAGYEASPVIEENLEQDFDSIAKKEIRGLKRRLVFSVILLLVLMYFSMGHSMAGWTVPAFAEKPIGMALIQMILSLGIMIINGGFFTRGFGSLFHGSPNMDTLVALGSTAAFGYSLVSFTYQGDVQNLYFESAAMIPTLITVGKLLEALSKGKTTSALKNLIKITPKKALVLREGVMVEIPAKDVREGDTFFVKPGTSIPVDGVVIEGASAVDESLLTGESIFVNKVEGDQVSAACNNQSGFLKCKATKVGEDTTFSQIIKLVNQAAATKAPLARIADKVSAVFVPAVIFIAIATIVVWLILGSGIGFAMARGICVLVISCPCALGLATPVAIMVGNGMGAKNGIIYKTAQAQEEMGRASIVVLDKTGTITQGKPQVTDILPVKGVKEEELLKIAFILEERSEHPLAQAIIDCAAKKISQGEMLASDGMKQTLANFKAVAGRGITVDINGETYFSGNFELARELRVEVNTPLLEKGEQLACQGKTLMYFGKGKKLLGIIAVADTIKEESKEAITQFKNMGLHIVMLTGDNEKTARVISREVGVSHVVAQVLPGEKEAYIRGLMEIGKVVMVGDGINDAPALTRANVGVAIGAGTDVAIDAADVVLMKSRLTDVAAAIRMSRATIRNIHENLFWAFIYNAVCIPLAIGVYGLDMKPVYGAGAMSLSSICVCLNALRLNTFKMFNSLKDKPRGETKISDDEITAILSSTKEEQLIDQKEVQGKLEAEKEIKKEMKKEIKQEDTNKKATKEDIMEKQISIEGMMCQHCAATVKKAIETIQGVERVTVDQEGGKAIATTSKDVDSKTIEKAVEEAGYKVTKI